MKIAVVAANGRVAKKVIAEALSRGHEVVAFGRHAENDTPAKEYIQKDLFDLTREDLAGFDAVVDAAAPGRPRRSRSSRTPRSISRASLRARSCASSLLAAPAASSSIRSTR